MAAAIEMAAWRRKSALGEMAKIIAAALAIGGQAAESEKSESVTAALARWRENGGMAYGGGIWRRKLAKAKSRRRRNVIGMKMANQQ